MHRLAILRTATFLWAVFIAVALMLPAETLERWPAHWVWVEIAGIDRWVHGVLFFVFGWLLLEARVFPAAGNPRPWLLALAVSTLYGGLSEVAQGLLAERTAEVGDFLADTFGAGLAVLLASGWRRGAVAPSPEVGKP